jgi:hypothetical protein
LRVLGETRPGLLYPQFDFFVHLLDHQNKIFQWEAARAVAVGPGRCRGQVHGDF